LLSIPHTANQTDTFEMDFIIPMVWNPKKKNLNLSLLPCLPAGLQGTKGTVKSIG